MGHLSTFGGRRAFGLTGLQLLAASGIALSSLAGCGGGDDEGGDGASTPGTPKVVDKVEMDGFVLLLADGQLKLLDTETGKVSTESLPLSGSPNWSNHFSVSPNGLQIASVSNDGKLTIADVAYEGGAPALKVVRELTGGDYTRPRYTPDGLRIITTNVAVDPATGDSWPCVTDKAARYPLVAFPGGHRYICTDVGVLKEDGDVFATDVGAVAISADGQFADVGVHVPSGSTREVKSQPVNGPFSIAAKMPLADGTFIALTGSGSGEAVAQEAAGFVTVYKRIRIDAEQLDGRSFDLKPAFESGDWADAEGETWPLQKAGFPLLTEGDGRSTTPIGVSQDGRYALFASRAWNITSDPYTNVLYEVVIESAFSVVDREGQAKSYRTTTLGNVALIGTQRETDVEGAVLFQPELFQDAAVVDFGDGNMLVPVTGNGLSRNGWGGYFGGKPYLVQGVGRMSRDGRWFFVAGDAVSATDLRLCFTQVGSTSQECLSTQVGGEPVGIVGYGLKSSHAQEAPEILALSRSAAWPGSSVSVFGARFGDAGTLRVGDKAVEAANIVEWADDHIVFTMTDDLPESGEVVVETAQGKAGNLREFWLHRGRLVTTPFDGVRGGATPLGQGLNVVDLGQIEAEQGKDVGNREVVFSSGTRLDTGEYVVYSPGSAEPKTAEIVLQADGYSRQIFFSLENRLASDQQWQPIQVGLGAIDTNLQYPTFQNIAGDLVEFSTGSHPLVGERIELASFASRIPGTVAGAWGAPDFWRAAEDEGAWVLNKTDNVTKIFNKVLAWDGQAQWGAPRFATAPQAALLPFLQGVEAAGQVMILTGSDLLGTGKAGFQLSTNGGMSFGAMTLVDEALGNASSSLLEPIRVEAKSGTFFLVLESLGAGDIAGIHAISTTGTLSKGVAEVPAGAKLPAGLAPAKAKLDYVNFGGKLLLHIPLSHTLVATDFDAAGEAPKAWQALPSDADAGHVLHIWQDPKSALIYAVKDDGTVLSSPGDAFDDPSAWKEVDLGIELALPTTVQPVAVSRLEDGRWFVLANLKDAKSPNEPSPWGGASFLIGPKP